MHKTVVMIRRSNKNIYSILVTMLLISIASPVFGVTSEDYVKRASEYASNGKIRSAIIELKNALQKNEKNIRARLLLGEVYLKAGDGVSAEKELQRAKKLGASKGKLMVLLGKAYLLQGKHDEVLKGTHDDQAYSVSTRAEIISLRGQARLQNRENEKAGKLFRQALDLESETISAMFGLVRIDILNKSFDVAGKQAKKLTSKYKDNDEAWLISGEIARLNNRPEDAQQRFDKAVKLNPYNLSALLGKASANIALDKLDDAIKDTDLVLKIVAKHPMANYLRSIALFKQKNTSAAVESLQKVLQVAPNHIPSLHLMGSIHFSKGEFEQAAKTLSRVLTTNPDNVNVVKMLAATHLRTKQPEKVIELLKPLASNSKDSQMLAMLGNAYLQNRENNKGMDYLEKAIELTPNSAGVKTQLALAQLISGNSSKAIEQLESVVELSPDLMQAEVMLVLAHMRNRSFEMALKSALNLQQKNANSPVPLNLAGAAYLGLQKRGEAGKQFREALKLDPDFVPAAINLAKIDEQDNKTDSAKTRYIAIIKHRAGHIGALMSLARISEKEGKQKEALRYVEKAYELNSGNVLPGLLLIRYHLKQKNTLKALSVARALKNTAPDNPKVVKSLGMAQAANKEYSSAISSFRSLEKLQPNSPEPAWLIGKAWFQIDDLSSAKKEFQKSLHIKDNYVPAHLALIDLEMKDGHPEYAVSIAKKLQKQYPKQALGYQVAGDIFSKTKAYNKAIKQYKKAMNQTKTTELVLKLSSAYAMAGKTKQNYSLLEDWLKDNSDSLSVMHTLAGHYQKNALPEKAIKHYLQIIKNQPTDVAALNNLAWLYHESGQAGAVDYARRAYDLAPENYAVIDTFGWLLVETGETNRGLVLLQQAVIKAPHIAEIRYHLGVSLQKAGRKEDAKIELRKVLDMSPDSIEAKSARALLTRVEK